MRVALVWPGPDLLANISVRFEHYIHGFRLLGHEAFAVAPRTQLDGFTWPSVACQTPEELRDPVFWHALQPDMALVITWLGHSEILEALRPSCKHIVSIADSDGQIGTRAHPRATILRMVGQHRTVLNKVRAAKYWLQQYLYLWKTLDDHKLASIRAADLVVVGNTAAKANILRFLDCHKVRDELEKKILIAPYPVASCFLNGNIPVQRKDRIVAIGRWESPQKDVRLLLKVLARVLHARPGTEAYVIGTGGEAVFQAIRKKTPRFHYLGPQAPSTVAHTLAESRCLLITSRWESGPIVANEALCMGCSIVGPEAIPALSSFCGSGPFGTASPTRSERGLASSLIKELEAWDRGFRNCVATAQHWRPVFDPVNVCASLIKAAEQRYSYDVNEQ